MRTLAVFAAVIFAQNPGEGTSQVANDRLKAVLERAAKEPDFDAAGLILYSAFSDESLLRLAYLTPEALDERSMFIVFGGDWGSRTEISWVKGRKRRSILVESVSAKPELIRSVLRADRYVTYQRKRELGGGAMTINFFPFFSGYRYADDLAESFFETLRKETTHPAEALKAPHGGGGVMISAEEMELNLLETWQLLCGLCDRLDLIDKATTKNWRDRFPDLDRWFQKNRPFILWENDKSCVRIDAEAKEDGDPTPRKSRSIPELKPPWIPQ